MITTLDPGTALVLIDLQKGIVSRQLATPVSTILGKAASLVEAFHQAGLPVVVVNVKAAGAAWTKTRKDAAPVSSAPSPDAHEIVPEIKALASDIFITKHTWNAFYETELHQRLQERDITGIVLAGIATSIGVEGTARTASELGYNIAFAEDAMTDMSAEAHAHSVRLIFPRIGEVGSTADVIGKLRRQ